MSPILANIYLDQFDKYMAEYAENFKKGNKRKVNPEYDSLNKKLAKVRKKWKSETDETVKACLFERIKELQAKCLSVPAGLQMDANYRRLQYVRYADDFLIGVIGSKADSESIKADITQYMSEKLLLELSAEKTLITHASENAKFLGFDITVQTLDDTKRNFFIFGKDALHSTVKFLSKCLVKAIRHYVAKTCAGFGGVVGKTVIVVETSDFKVILSDHFMWFHSYHRGSCFRFPNFFAFFLGKFYRSEFNQFLSDSFGR